MCLNGLVGFAPFTEVLLCMIKTAYDVFSSIPLTILVELRVAVHDRRGRQGFVNAVPGNRQSGIRGCTGDWYLPQPESVLEIRTKVLL